MKAKRQKQKNIKEGKDISLDFHSLKKEQNLVFTRRDSSTTLTSQVTTQSQFKKKRGSKMPVLKRKKFKIGERNRINDLIKAVEGGKDPQAFNEFVNVLKQKRYSLNEDYENMSNLSGPIGSLPYMIYKGIIPDSSSQIKELIDEDDSSEYMNSSVGIKDHDEKPKPMNLTGFDNPYLNVKTRDSRSNSKIRRVNKIIRKRKFTDDSSTNSQIASGTR